MTATTSLNTGTEFWIQVTQPDYQDFKKDTTDLRKIIHAVSSLYHLHEWLFRQYETTPAKIYECASSSDFRKHLIDHECSDFALLRDLADANKHFLLGRQSAQITTANQMKTRSTVWREGSWAKSAWAEGSWGKLKTIVRLDDGKSRIISDVAKNVYEMWDGLFQANAW